MKYLPKVGMWATEAPGPCKQCNGPGGTAYVLEQTDEPVDSFCGITCWAKWWDANVALTGDLPDQRVEPAPWQPQAWAHARQEWGDDPTKIGITRAVRAGTAYLLYRDNKGQLVGVLRRRTTGAYHVFVDPELRRQGIGKTLMRAGAREWGVRRDAQRYTHDGAALDRYIDRTT